LKEQVTRKRDASSVWKNSGKWKLIEFGVENSHEDNNCQTEEGKHAEGQVTEYPESRSRCDIDVSIKKADTAGNEKNEGYYH
jgi:hypothetical protein